MAAQRSSMPRHRDSQLSLQFQSFNFPTAEDSRVWIQQKQQEFGNDVKEFYYLREPRQLNRAEQERVRKIPAANLRLATQRTDRGQSALVIMGQGKSGTVYKGYLRNNAQFTATEVVVKESRDNGSSNIRMLCEAQYLQYLQDTNSVPKLYGIVHRRGLRGLCIVQGLFGKGVTLQDVLENSDLLPQNQRRLVAWNLLRGLQAIHAKGVQVNDIHTRNILVDVDCPNKSVRYIDLGKASMGPVATRSYLRRSANRRRYAPEVLDGGLLTQEAEVYTLGFLLKFFNKGVEDAAVARACEICMSEDPSKRDLALATAVFQVPRVDLLGRVIHPVTAYVQNLAGCFCKYFVNEEERERMLDDV